MRNTITLNGQVSSEINGLIIQELPPISKPLVRTEVEEIDGRDGDIVTALGYSAYDKEITVGVYGNYDINEIIAYFNSEGVVTFSNEPDKYYNYQIVQQIDFERLVRYRTATVTFHCQPFKYSTTEGEEILDPPAQNLLSIPDFNKTTNGVTLTVSDGVISVSGTPSAATEFYVPTGGLSLPAGTFTLSAQANGTGVAAASIRLIGSVPSDSDSLGGNYIALKNGQTVSIKGTLSATKNFGYLWFYITTGGALDFTMTAKVENEAEKVASDEGTALMLLNTPEAPFSKFDLKGNTYQQTYSGINLLPPTANFQETVSGVNVLYDNGVFTISGTSTGSGGHGTTWRVPIANYTIEAGDYWQYKNDFISQQMLIQLRFTDNTTFVQAINTEDRIIDLSSYVGKTIKDYRLYFQSGYDFNGTMSPMIVKSSTSTTFEPYVGGIPAPNPNYPQEVLNVKHQNMIRLTGKNLVSANELYLYNVERTSDGLKKTITASTLATYYSSSIANPLGIYTVSFEARVLNAGEATLVLSSRASIWGNTGLTLKDKDGNVADEIYRTLGGNWKKYSFTVIAYTSEPWTLERAMRLAFSTYTNSPEFELKNFQIEAGAAATDFDGSTPQMYPIDFRIGKNMLSMDFLTIGRLSSNGTTNATIKYHINNALSPLKVNPSATYSISANLGETVKGMRVWVQECDENTVPLGNPTIWKQLASNAYTFTTRGDTQYIKLDFSLSTTSSTVIADDTEDTTEFNTAYDWLRGATLQVEEGEATEYEAYQSIELCKIGDYQDYIRKLGDDWYVHKAVGKVIFTGTEDWSLAATYTNNKRFVCNDIITNSASNTVLSDYFTQGVGGSDTENVAINNSNRKIMLTISNSTVSNLADFKTWLGSNNTTVYYILATPTETKITNPTTIATLEAMKNNAHAYKGVTFVSSLPGGISSLQLISSVEVIKSSDGVVTNAGNFISKPKLTVYGSGDIGISINGVQVFQIALGNEEYITIDTAAMEAYQDSTENLKNRLVTGDYENFYLNPGANQITFSGVVTQCIVENYSRWL